MTDDIRKIEGLKCSVISDMSGFTRLVKTYGPIHYTTLILLNRLICEPIAKKHHVEHVFYEADNFWGIFPDAVQGAKAGLEMLQTLSKYNSSISTPDDRIKISGIGINVGDDIYVDNNDGKMYGKTVSVCFKMGEDIGEGGELVVTKEVLDILKGDSFFSGISSEEGHSDLYGGFDFYRIRDVPDLNPELIPPTVSDDHYAHLFVERSTRTTPEEKQEMDQKILHKFERPITTILMYGVDFTSVLEKFGMEHFLHLKVKFLDLLAHVFAPFEGKRNTDLIFSFGDCSKALLASIAAKQAIAEKFSADINEPNYLPFEGFGLHVGNILEITGCELLLGDAINTASKLGEDIAQGGDVNISEQVRSLILQGDNEAAKALNYTEREGDIGNMTLTYFTVTN